MVKYVGVYTPKNMERKFGNEKKKYHPTLIALYYLTAN